MHLGPGLGAYVLVAILVLIPTCLEQRANGVCGAWRLASFAVCLLWPLSTVVVATLAWRAGRRDRRLGRRPWTDPLQG